MAGSSSRCPVRLARCGRCGASGSCPRLGERGMGVDPRRRHATARSAIGESVLAERLRRSARSPPSPSVATYAAAGRRRCPGRRSRWPGHGSAAALADGAEASRPRPWPGAGDRRRARLGPRRRHLAGCRRGRPSGRAGGGAGDHRARDGGRGDGPARLDGGARPCDGRGPRRTRARLHRGRGAGRDRRRRGRDGRRAGRDRGHSGHDRVHGPGSLEHKESRTILLRGDVARARLGAAVAHVLLGVVRSAA